MTSLTKLKDRLRFTVVFYQRDLYGAQSNTSPIVGWLVRWLDGSAHHVHLFLCLFEESFLVSTGNNHKLPHF